MLAGWLAGWHPRAVPGTGNTIPAVSCSPINPLVDFGWDWETQRGGKVLPSRFNSATHPLVVFLRAGELKAAALFSLLAGLQELCGRQAFHRFSGMKRDRVVL